MKSLYLLVGNNILDLSTLKFWTINYEKPPALIYQAIID